MAKKQIFNTSAELNYPSVLPTLDLDFANSKTLDPRITFRRASGGSYFGPDGRLRYAGVNEPRFDHNPTTGESLGLLVEEQRTNLLLRSEEFDNAAWVKTRTSVTANAIVAPDGSLTADRINEDTTATSTHLVAQTGALITSVGTRYTYSVYAKADGRDWLIVSSGGTWGYAWFNVSNGTLGTIVDGGGATTASITEAGNGWYRCIVSATAVEARGLQLLLSTSNSIITYTGDGTSGLYIWGAQLEAGAFPTSYIPTTDSAATRAADVASITGSAFSSWYRQDEGTVFADYIGVNNVTGATRRVVEIGASGAAGDRMILGYNSTVNSRFLVVSGSATQADINPLATQGALIKAAAGFAGNNFQQGVNGALGSADTSGTVPTVSALAIGTDFSLLAGSALNGHIRRLTYWPQRLGNSTLQSITA